MSPAQKILCCLITLRKSISDPSLVVKGRQFALWLSNRKPTEGKCSSFLGRLASPQTVRGRSTVHTFSSSRLSNHSGHRVTQNCSSSPLILFNGYPRLPFTSLQRQRTPKLVPTDQNNLTTTTSNQRLTNAIHQGNRGHQILIRTILRYSPVSFSLL